MTDWPSPSPDSPWREILRRAEERRQREDAVRERTRQYRKADGLALVNCHIRAEEVRGVPDFECYSRRICFRCGKALPKRRRVWCSDECVDIWWRNHEWSGARYRAMRRSSGLTDEQFERVGSNRFLFYRCEQCASPEGDLEVNHVVPRSGRGYHPGCHNHQTNLEVLCHPCHVRETARQLRARAAVEARRTPKAATIWEGTGA